MTEPKNYPRLDPKLEKLLEKADVKPLDISEAIWQPLAQNIPAQQNLVVTTPGRAEKTVIAVTIAAILSRYVERIWYVEPRRETDDYRTFRISAALSHIGTSTFTRGEGGDFNAPVLIWPLDMVLDHLADLEDIPWPGALILNGLERMDHPQDGALMEALLLALPADIPVAGVGSGIANIDAVASWLETLKGRPCRSYHADIEPMPRIPAFLTSEWELLPLLDRKKLSGRVKRSLKELSPFDADSPKFMRELLEFLGAGFGPALAVAAAPGECDSAVFRGPKAAKKAGDPLTEPLVSRILDQNPDIKEAPLLKEVLARRIGTVHENHHPLWNRLMEHLMAMDGLDLIVGTPGTLSEMDVRTKSVLFLASETPEPHKEAEEISHWDGNRIIRLAGRRGVDDAGWVIAVHESDTDPVRIKDLFLADEHSLSGAFRCDFRTVLALCSQARFGVPKDMLERSFTGDAEEPFTGFDLSEFRQGLAEEIPNARCSGHIQSVSALKDLRIRLTLEMTRIEDTHPREAKGKEAALKRRLQELETFLPELPCEGCDHFSLCHGRGTKTFRALMEQYYENLEPLKESRAGLLLDLDHRIESLRAFGLIDDEDRLTEMGKSALRTGLETPQPLVECLRQGVFEDLEPQIAIALAGGFIEMGEWRPKPHMEENLRSFFSDLEPVYAKMEPAIDSARREMLRFGFAVKAPSPQQSAIILAWTGETDERTLKQYTGIPMGPLAELIRRTRYLCRQLNIGPLSGVCHTDDRIDDRSTGEEDIKEGENAPIREKERDENMMQPLVYRIHLEPDPDRFRFSGNVKIRFQVRKPSDTIVLNILDLAVWRCEILRDGEKIPCAFSAEPRKEELIITLPEPAEGEIEIFIEYEGNINDQMAGFYRSGYKVGEETRYIAVTQFQESDARRVFPCMDHPQQKAVFEIEMVCDRRLTPIANTLPVEERKIDENRRLTRFAPTPKMSTYLLFMGIGEFDIVGDSEDPRIRVITTPGLTRYGKLGLDFGKKALQYCEEYYDIPFPLPKLDQIAVPDFAFGAMENWGAITYRENLLLDFPEITSKAGRERICEVIAHETAHQWFGNLVTPSDWKYLWLNESFATYFGFGVVDHYYPEWEIWDQFIHTETHVALVRDALHETFPIEIPGGEHVVINASTAPIIYNKGGSILRQVEGYIGTESFQGGLRSYLKKFEYGCASSHDLWDALAAASDAPITRMMKGWVEQPGFPVIEARRDSDELTLTQRRFTYLPNDSEQVWPVPVILRLFDEKGESRAETILLEKVSETIPIDPGTTAFKINDGQTGFYRVRYEEKDLENLAPLVKEKVLSPQDRWGLESDLYEQVKAANLTPDKYLDFLDHYRDEDAFLPLVSIAGNLFGSYLILSEKWKERIASTAKGIFEPLLARIGYEPAEDEPHTTSLLRDRIIWPLALYGSDETREFCRKRFSVLQSGGRVHPDIAKSVMQVAALSGGEEVWEWLINRLKSTESEHERMNILIAMGCFSDKSLIDRAKEYILEKVPSRNRFVPISALTMNPHAIPDMWNWYQENLRALEAFHPIHYERVIESIMPVCGLVSPDAVKAFFKEYGSKKPAFKDIINLSLEKLEINLRMAEM